MSRTQSIAQNKQNEEKYEIYYVRKSKKKKNLCQTMFSAKSYYVKAALLISILIIAMTIAVVYFFVYNSKSVATENIEKTVVAKTSSTENLKIIADKIIFNNHKGIWSYDAVEKKPKLLQKIDCEISSFDAYSEEIIFWTDHCQPIINAIPKEYPSIKYPKGLIPKSIALDFITAKVYVLDALTNSLNVLDMKGDFAIVLLDLKNPHDLILDLMEGFVFISQIGHSIVRSTMDGNLTKILQTPGISAMTIDRKTKTIYWSIDYTSIESSDYDGGSRKQVISFLQKVNSLAVIGDRLYVPETIEVTKDNIPYESSSMRLWNCRLRGRTCKKIEADWIFFDEPIINGNLFIKEASRDPYQPIPANPCRDQNGNCDQLCLLGQDGRHSCTCRVRWQLKPDSQSCDIIANSLIYIQNRMVRMKSLSAVDRAFIDVILPITLTEGLSCKDSIDFDYDVETRKMFYSNGQEIYFLNLHTDSEYVMIHDVSKDYCIRDLALDWRTKKLFFVKESKSVNNSHSIEVIDTEHIKTLSDVLKFKYIEDVQFNGCPYSLILHNELNQLYFTAYNGTPNDLQRINSDGTGLKLISQLRYYNNQKILAVDYQANRLYWILDRYDGEIKHANLDGKDERVFKLEGLRNLSFLDVQESWLYVGDGKSVWRFDKLTGRNASRVAPTFEGDDNGRITGARAYSIRNCKNC